MKSNKLTKFKRTEIGMIPSDWEVVCINDIATKVIRGSGISRDDITKEGIDCIRYGELYTSYNTIIKKCMSHTMKDKILCPKYIKNGTIVFALTGESVEDIAKSSVYMGEDKCMIGGDICAIEHTENPVYVGYAMETKYAVNQKKFGKTKTKVVHSSTNEILNFRIAKPSKPEQEKIANALTRIDNLIEDYEKLIKKKEKIKQGLMQNLLTEKVRLKGFDDKWEKVLLEEVLDYEQPTKYIVRSTNYLNKGIPVLTAGKSLVLGYTNELINVYDKGEVIIFDDFLATSKFINYPFKIKSSAIKLLTKKRDTDYLSFIYYKMQDIDFLAYEHKRYWISEYSKIKIELPSGKEQQAISKVLSNADNEINDLKIKLNKIIDIKKGMLDNLLTGRIRL